MWKHLPPQDKKKGKDKGKKTKAEKESQARRKTTASAKGDGDWSCWAEGGMCESKHQWCPAGSSRGSPDPASSAEQALIHILSVGL